MLWQHFLARKFDSLAVPLQSYFSTDNKYNKNYNTSTLYWDALLLGEEEVIDKGDQFVP